MGNQYRLTAAAVSLTAALVSVACSDSPNSLATAPRDAAVATQAAATTGLPKIGHVFIVILENEDVLATYGPNSPATYLIDTLAPMGTFMSQYYGIGHASLDNYTAAVSGQAPDSSTSADCNIYSNFVPRGPNGGWLPNGQIAGEGCVYPKGVWTIGQQMNAAHLTWKAYMEDMGNNPSREASVCGHVPIGSVDITNNETPEDQYAARHNPFVWFHSIIDGAECNNVVSLNPLQQDLQSVATTPNYVWITPNVCHDGHDSPCITGEPGGLVSANLWLKEWMPLILNSPAYKQDGMVIIISDESEGSNRSVACCGEQPGPNEAFPGGTGDGGGPGGGDVGAVAISKFITPGGFDDTQYNHYSLLASVFNIFNLQKFGQHQLGYAGAAGLPVFGSDLFTNPTGAAMAQRVKLGPSVSSAALLAKHGYLQISAK